MNLDAHGYRNRGFLPAGPADRKDAAITDMVIASDPGVDRVDVDVRETRQTALRAGR